MTRTRTHTRTRWSVAVPLVLVLTVLLWGVSGSVSAQTLPDESALVEALWASAPWDRLTKAGNGCFTEAVAYRLHQKDPRWGHLKKRPGQNQWNGHAVDAILYRRDTPGQSQAVDIISNSETPKANEAWIADIPRYSSADFLVPTASCTPSGTPPPPPPPPPPPLPDPVAARVTVLESQVQQLTDTLTRQTRALEQVTTRVTDLSVQVASLADQLGATTGKTDNLYLILRDRPIPSGCSARWVGCTFRFDHPPIPGQP